jgi:glutaredoxin 3
MREAVVYTTEPCGYCVRVKMLLKSRGVEFREVNLVSDPRGLQELAERTGMMTLPQVVIDGELVGGYRDTVAAVEPGRLDELLTA